MKALNQLLDFLSEFLSKRKGLLPLIGLLLVVINFILHFVQPGSPLVEAELCLTLGVILAVLGVLFAWAL